MSREYKELGEQFEEREHKLFGERGFGAIVEEIAGYEKKIGIYDLAASHLKARSQSRP